MKRTPADRRPPRRAAAHPAPLALVLAAVLAPSAAAQKPAAGDAGAAAQAPAGAEQRFDDLGLTLRLPAAMHVTAQPVPAGKPLRARWTGKLGAADVQVDLILFEQGSYHLDEPNDVTQLIDESLGSNGAADAVTQFDDRKTIAGKFGYAGYAELAHGSRADAGGTHVLSEIWCLCGLLEQRGYAVQVDAKPGLPGTDAALVRSFLATGVSYEGRKRDWKWTDAEVRQRWKDSVPDADKLKLEDPLRTAHYVIITNSSGGKAFAKKMEDCYAAIKAVYPFDEVPERRLMPVFLFRTNDEYFAFFARSFDTSLEMARKSKGVSSGDFYATWYEYPGDPVHIHEATHQIFRNRLGLGGGGSWFQEGVAEYMSTRDNERGAAAHAVKKGRHVPLAEFMKIPSLLFSPGKKDPKAGEDEAADQYEEAALIVEFLRQGKFGKDRFQDYIHAVGSTPPNDVPAIEAALKKVYGVDVAGLERELVEYCKKR